MELNQLTVIDWELGLKLAGNQQDLANELLDFLMKDLEIELSIIQETYKQGDIKDLLHRVHKLHGAVAYCGLPRLKTALAQLETSLKTNIMDNLPHLINQLGNEVSLLLEHYHNS